MIKAHTRDDSKRIYGLISYTVSPEIANSFAKLGNNQIVKKLNLPAKNIISSQERLKKLLALPTDIKKEYLRNGVGFNINRLVWKSFSASDPDTEQEIAVFKWE